MDYKDPFNKESFSGAGDGLDEQREAMRYRTSSNPMQKRPL